MNLYGYFWEITCNPIKWLLPVPKVNLIGNYNYEIRVILESTSEHNTHTRISTIIVSKSYV